jgi:hypothetical protein
MQEKRIVSRRDFLKLAAAGMGTFALRSFPGPSLLPFPKVEKLGRITVGKMDLKTRPNADSQTVGAV